MLEWPVTVHYNDSYDQATFGASSITVRDPEHTSTHNPQSPIEREDAIKAIQAMNYSQHDELAALFAQQMTFDAARQVSESIIVAPSAKELEANQPTAFISAHYIHPTGLALSTSSGSEPSRSPPPPYKESLIPEAMADVLIQNSIDPASLLPNQIELFSKAGYEQRLRLLELWRISPPSYLPLEEHVDASWGPTSMEQEESLARVRYETAIIARGVDAYQQTRIKNTTSLGTHEESMSSIREPEEAGWPPAAHSASTFASQPSSRPISQAEPYMLAGYHNSLHQPHLDPVYAANNGLWQAAVPGVASIQEQSMADQYGQIMQIRNHADWEASVRQSHNSAYDNDDMIM